MDVTRVRVARWPNGARAPLNLMIDDLADVFIPARGCRGSELDWGHLGRGPDSAWRFVEKHLLAPFPELKISVFIPVNRQPKQGPPPGSRFHPIDQRPEMVAFLRGLAQHPRVECCYHGKDHFRGQGSDRDQEFRTYNSQAEAVAETERGLEIWESVFGCPPLGGKYPGYVFNEWSDAAVAACGFRWWCRRFNRGTIQSNQTPLTELTPVWFAQGHVLDMPSNLAGNVLPPWLGSEWHKWPKRLLQRRRLKLTCLIQMQQLLTAGLPLTIQEHIAPSREDGRRQGINVQDDRSALSWMLHWACAEHVWHAHPTEIADHIRLRERSELHLDGHVLRLTIPAVDQLATLELELLDTRVVSLRGVDGQTHKVRSGPMGGSYCSLPLPLSSPEYQVEVAIPGRSPANSP